MQFLQMIAQPPSPPAVLAGMGQPQASQSTAAAPSIFDAILQRGNGKQDLLAAPSAEEKVSETPVKVDESKPGADLFLLMAILQTAQPAPPQVESAPASKVEGGGKGEKAALNAVTLPTLQAAPLNPESDAGEAPAPGKTEEVSILPQPLPGDMPAAAPAKGADIPVKGVAIGAAPAVEVKEGQPAPIPAKAFPNEVSQQTSQPLPQSAPPAEEPAKASGEISPEAWVKADTPEKSAVSRDERVTPVKAETQDIPVEVKVVTEQKQAAAAIPAKGEALPGVNPVKVPAEHAAAKIPETAVIPQSEGGRAAASDMQGTEFASGLAKEKGKGGEESPVGREKGDSGFAGNLMTQAPPPQEAVKGTERTTAVEKTPHLNREDIFSQVREGLERHGVKGDGAVSIKLHPEELGELRLNIRVEDQRVKVEVLASHRMVKDLLMDNLESLKETLQKHRLNMESFDVSTNVGNGSSRQFSEGREPGQTPVYAALGGIDPAEPSVAQAEKWEERDDALVDVRL